MQRTLDQSARRQILADLGIEVWRIRAPAPAQPEVGESRSGDRSHPGDSTVAAVSRPRSEVGESRSGDRSYGGPPAVQPEPAQPFTVTSLSADGVTLLLDGALVRRDLRLAADLLAAATGRWELEPATRRFDWPPAPAITAAAGDRSAERALRAFVEKELADQASTLLILSRAVEARLEPPRTAGDRLVVADFEALARDPVVKREAWARLGQYRLARARSASATGAAEPTTEKTPPLENPEDLR